jgi:hypothetical protein
MLKENVWILQVISEYGGRFFLFWGKCGYTSQFLLYVKKSKLSRRGSREICKRSL